jgi:hypothetical protein
VNATACDAVRRPRAGVRAGRVCICALLLGVLPVWLDAKPLPGRTSLFPPGVTAGTEVEVRAGGEFPSWPVQINVERFGRAVDTLRVKCAETSGELHIDARQAAPGAYTIRLYDPSGAVSPCPFYVGTLPEVVEVEPNATVQEVQRLPSADIVVNGRLEKNGDVDSFAFELEKGETLVASMDAHAALGSPMDATLQILSTDSFVLAENDDDAGLDPRLVFRAPESGLYVIRTLAFPATPNQRIHLHGSSSYVYRLTLTTGPFAAQALPMTISEVGSRRVSVVGWNRKFLPGELEVAVEPLGGYATLAHDRLANTLALPVVSHASLLESPPGASGLQRLEFPSSLTGCVERAAEEDRYAFAGAQGKSLRFEVFARRWGSPLDAVLRVRDAAGKELASNDDGAGRDAKLDFNPGADGDYSLEITDLHGRGGERFLYCVRATVVGPDFTLQVGSDRLVLLVGEPLEIPVTVARLDGFDAKAEIALVVEGLPDHVAVEVKTTEQKDGPPNLSLVLTANSATPFSGPFSIHGRANDQERRATATLQGFPPRTASLWLTVREPERKRL